MNYLILENIYLSSNGMTFDENMNTIKVNRNHDLVYTEKFNFNKTIELPDKEYVDLTHYYSFWPFAHRYDEFSRIRHIENTINNATYLIGNEWTRNQFSQNRFDEERLLFGVKNTLYHPTNETLFKIKKLIYPLWLYGEAPCAFTKESFDFCRKKYENLFGEKSKDLKIFLTRQNISRSITNYVEVHNFFEKNNYIIINGSEDLKRCIYFFRNAEIIVGIHGGLFSNLLFCDNIKNILEIFPSQMYNGCFIGWNEHLKTKYESKTFNSDQNCNINLSKENLEEIISSVE